MANTLMFNASPVVAQKFSAYMALMRLNRPIGTFLLLWPTLWALWLAGDGSPDPTVVLIFIAGTILMRAAGCVINDFADRKFDPHVARTRNRPLATGALNTTHALTLFAVLLTCALILVLQLNKLTIVISIFAAIVALVYPFTKRFTQLPQAVLGVAFSMGIPMAYAALSGTVPFEAWLLFLGNFLWIMAYDTQYAMTDREDDLLIGIKSTAILFGRKDNLMIGLLHACAFIIIGYLGWSRDLNWHFYFGLGCAAGFAIFQQQLCRDHVPENCFRAFLNNNWIGAMIFFGLVLGLIPQTVFP